MSRSHAILAVLLVFIASARIVSTYTVLSHTMDEPDHLACGMQWLNGAYTWDTEHPPIARVLAAVAVSLAGERLVPADGSYLEGCLIFGRDDHYDRILSIARFGVLPLFWIASLAVFLWAKRAGGPRAAVIATFLFTTTPPVLAHAGLVTTDMACTAFGALAFLASLWWADRPDRSRTVLFGIALGLAAAAKFSLLAYLPAAWFVLLAIRRPPLSKMRPYIAPVAVIHLPASLWTQKSRIQRNMPHGSDFRLQAVLRPLALVRPYLEKVAKELAGFSDHRVGHVAHHEEEQSMRTVIYAATRHGYSVQAIDGGQIIYEYVAGNHQEESTAIIDPSSTNAVKLSQLRRWAKQTADQIAEERGIPANLVEYDPDLETQLDAISC